MDFQAWVSGAPSLPKRLGLLLAAAGLGLATPGCGPRSPTPASRDAAAAPAAEVELFEVVSRPLEQTIAATGSLEPFERSELGFKVAGMLAKFRVDVGAEVRAGDVLAELDRSDFESRVEQADAALAQAQARLGIPPGSADDSLDPAQTPLVQEAEAVLAEATASRTRLASLKAQGIVPETDVEAAEAAFRVAQSRGKEARQEALTRIAALRQRRAELNAAKRQLEEAKLRAPFDGVVQERRRGSGEYVATGSPVVALVRNNPMRLRLKIPERLAPLVRSGQQLRFKLSPTDAAWITAPIARISPILSEASRMLLVEADIPPGEGLRPGIFVAAEVVVDAATPTVTVPKEAVAQFAGVESAFVASGGKAVERRVATGRDLGKEWEILSGLSAGDQVVLRPGNLRPGQALRPKGRND